MRPVVYLVLLFALLIAPAICHAQQATDPQQALQGLLTGDKARDRGLIQAFQRGYQRGLEDSQQQCKAEMAKAMSDCKKPK
jgi:ribosome modulation factor